jgi:hypothetical protein
MADRAGLLFQKGRFTVSGKTALGRQRENENESLRMVAGRAI